MVFASAESATKLTLRHEQVDVVRAWEILCHPDDGFSQRLLAVMVG
jgi:hypothetical protein